MQTPPAWADFCIAGKLFKDLLLQFGRRFAGFYVKVDTSEGVIFSHYEAAACNTSCGDKGLNLFEGAPIVRIGNGSQAPIVGIDRFFSFVATNPL
ncbi:hypothetical protein [Sulfitobacter sp. BSw21498]|uniref:hypothetical protein n=1 Tax=Sulfitobacter sp. BSw21498 TaxID=664426 RepID=UPI0020C77164|nr:hypothetical protein [Sulfitobacter sp. BSw21498]